MSIDDELGVLMHQANEEVESSDYLPTQTLRLGLSAVSASLLNGFPFVSQVITTLLQTSGGRAEKRFLEIVKALEARIKFIADQIEDQAFYSSEEFQTLLLLVLDRIHTTHQKEKLRLFGESLANSGMKDFSQEDKEAYVRTLRDMSLSELDLLRRYSRVTERRPTHAPTSRYRSGETARLISFGLLEEVVKSENRRVNLAQYARLNLPQERLLKTISIEIERELAKQPISKLSLSPFGTKFLRFIETEHE